MEPRRRSTGVAGLAAWCRGKPDGLHDGALALLGPGVVLLVGGVDEGVGLLVLLDELAHPAGGRERANER